MLMNFGQDYDTPPSDSSSGGGALDWLTAITQAAPQITQTVTALKPLWTGTTPATGYTQSTTPRPPVQQASALSGNLPLILGGAAVLGLGAMLLMKKRR